MTESSSGEGLPKSEENGGLTIIHKDSGILENTIGRIAAFPTHLALWTPDAILKDVPSEMAEYLREQWKDVNWRGNIEVYLNHSPFFRQLKRLFAHDRRMNLFTRIFLGLPYTIGNTLHGKFFRLDAYNPFTETSQIYHASKAIAARELGYAEDFDKSDNPLIRTVAYNLPISRAKLEWNASHNAMKHLREEDRDPARKILEPAFGARAGATAGMTGYYLFPSPIWAVSAFAGLVAGHAHARGSKDNIFFDQNMKLPDLKNIWNSVKERVSAGLRRILGKSQPAVA